MTEITHLPADPNQLDGLSPYTPLHLIARGHVEDWPALSENLTNYLQALHRNFAGLFVQQAHGEGTTAFIGPFITPGEYSIADPPISAMLVSYGEGSVRPASRIMITEERRAEIATSYTLPTHLQQPANQIEAAISYIVAKLAGIDYDFTKSFGQLAAESQTAIIASSDFSTMQRHAAALYGESVFATAQFNALYRAEQLESLEHVLRFLLYSNYIKEDRFATKPPVLSMWTDYHDAGGLLAGALRVVQGHSYFPDVYEDEAEGLRMGLLPPKHRITITHEATLISDGITERPIWPAEKVQAFQDAQKAQAQARRRAAEQKENKLFADRARAQREAGEKTLEVQAQLIQLADAGFTWKGVMPRQGRLSTAEGVNDYLARSYPGKETRIIDGVAIYGGEKIVLDSTSFTIYVQEDPA